MLPWLLDLIQPLLNSMGYGPGPVRMLRFITVRAAMALGLSFIISLIIGPWLIERLRMLKAGQVIRSSKKEGALSLADMHGAKAGTPTMGGLLMMAALLPTVLLVCRLDSFHLLLVMAMTFGYGAIGFWDDYLILLKRDHRGLSPRQKMLWQALLGLVLGLTLMLGEWPVVYETTGATGYPYLTVPFFKTIYLDLGWFYIPFVIFVMLGTSNAVNLTDGLDGLAIGVTAANAAAFLIVAYLVTRIDFANYLFVPYVNGGAELVVFLAALLGASLGFLWFNSHPAQLFMGDTGSMMLGGALGATAILLKQEMLLVVIGGVFVVEALSVMAQVSSFKLTGRRILRMSPLHHHYEKLGLHESKIIIRFWLVSWLLAMAGLAMLKMR